KTERSVGELLGDLMHETTTLVRQEITLAKNEMIQKASQAGRQVASLAIGGAVAYAGLLAIIAAIILLLIHANVTPWVAALLVGIVVTAIGGAMVMKGVNALKHADMAPRQTIETLKEDAQWAKDQTK
ncbi:MAG: phage holin family protein, partial [Armatimonadetes bacterium]|nr:phage holin family protein [Armatimonadota bacterium]